MAVKLAKSIMFNRSHQRVSFVRSVSIQYVCYCGILFPSVSQGLVIDIFRLGSPNCMFQFCTSARRVALDNTGEGNSISEFAPYIYIYITSNFLCGTVFRERSTF